MPFAGTPSQAQRAAYLWAAVVSQSSADVAAASFASELATLFACERVSVGLIKHGVVRIAAISHGTPATVDAEVCGMLQAAMEEACDQGATLRFPALAQAQTRITLAHQALHRRIGGGFCTIPLVVKHVVVGAVTLEFKDAAAFDDAQVAECEHLVTLICPVLHIMRRAERSWMARLIDTCREAWQAPGDSLEHRRRWLIAGASLVLLAASCVPLPYDIAGQARVEGKIQRLLVAPDDGYIKQAAVRPGDTVQAGQVLVEMAEQDLQSEYRKWSGELAQHENAHAAALAKADRAQLVISQARADEARAQIELVEQKLVRARVQAPFAGVVISGDLSQALGAPVKRGDPLLTLAPSDSFRIIIEVDERDIDGVQIGQVGRVALSAIPWDTLAITVVRITPMASAVEGNNVFEVEASLDQGSDRLKPGLRGIAKLEAGRRAPVWSWTRHALIWLGIRLWGWWGT